MDGEAAIKLVELEKRVDERFKHCDELNDEKFKALAKALELKARENELHFDKLNGEYQRVGAWKVECVNKEVYERDRKEMENKMSFYNKISLAVIGLGFTAIMVFMAVIAFVK